MTAVYADTAAVTVEIAHKNAQGGAITPMAASYRVLNEAGTELVGVTDASISSDPTPVIVPAETNTLAADALRGYRAVEMSFATASGTIIVTSGYLVEKATVLEVMINSYQTFGEAEINAAAMPDLEKWVSKTERERKMALIQAYHRLGTLAYRVTDWGEEHAVYQLNRLTAVQFNGLPDTFRAAIKRAQVAEADVILGGDSIINLRREGIMSESVGEVAQFFRPSKPLTLPISNRALRELQGFVRFSGRLGRS